METNAVNNDIEIRDTEKSSSSKNDSDSKKFVQISPESVVMIADSVGFSHVPDVVTKSLAEDTSYRLRELIQNCVQVLRHSKHQKLGINDVNQALRWSDIPTLYGQHPQFTDFEFLKEANIYTAIDKAVDLTANYPVVCEVEVYSPLRLGVQFLNPDSEDRTRSDIYAKYFNKISQSLMSTTSCVVQAALKDLGENAKLQPLLPSLIRLLRNLAEFANENVRVAKCIPLILQALMNNPHLNVEPQLTGFLKLLQDLILCQDDTLLSENNFTFASCISQSLYQLSLGNPVDQMVENLTSVIADPNKSLAIQCRSLLALRALGSECLVTNINCEQWNLLGSKLQLALERGDSTLYEQEAITSALVDVLRYRMRQLENESMPSTPDTEDQQKWREGWELYRLASEIATSSALRIGTFPVSICRKIQSLKAERRGLSCNELYWTIKSRQKPSPQAKWQFETRGSQLSDRQKLPSRPVDLQYVFEDLTPKVHNTIVFRVRNWRQRPSILLRSKVKTQIGCGSPSLFANTSRTKLKPISKYCPTLSPSFYHPVELIL